jgi:hypothetical protein
MMKGGKKKRKNEKRKQEKQSAGSPSWAGAVQCLVTPFPPNTSFTEKRKRPMQSPNMCRKDREKSKKPSSHPCTDPMHS